MFSWADAFMVFLKITTLRSHKLVKSKVYTQGQYWKRILVDICFYCPARLQRTVTGKAGVS